MTYQAGDIVQTRRTLRVTQILENGTLYLDDIQSGEGFRHQPNRDNGTLKLAMVRRAVRTAPKTGDVLTGRQIQARMWKRGTVIQCVEEPGVDLSPLLLEMDGLWTDSNSNRYEFDDLNSEAHFKLLHVAR